MKNFLNSAWRYAFKYKVVSLVALYFIFSTTLQAISGIDICIPCVWKSIFGFRCPGCGLTNAFIELLRLDVVAAYEHNALIFIVLPMLGFYFLKDWKAFYREQQVNSVQ